MKLHGGVYIIRLLTYNNSMKMDYPVKPGNDGVVVREIFIC